MIYLTVTFSPEGLHNSSYFRGLCHTFSRYIELLWGAGKRLDKTCVRLVRSYILC